jgi:hypothetical protein
MHNHVNFFLFQFIKLHLTIIIIGVIGETSMHMDISLKNVNLGLPTSLEGRYDTQDKSLYLIKPFDVQVYLYVYVYVHIYMYIYMYICIHICINMYTYIYTYIYTLPLFSDRFILLNSVVFHNCSTCFTVILALLRFLYVQFLIIVL